MHILRTTLAVVALSGAVTSACAAPAPEEVGESSAAQEGAYAPVLMRTDQKTVDLLQSHNSVLDSIGEPCVAPDDAAGAPATNVGELEYNVDLRIVKSKNALQNELYKHRSVSFGFNLGGVGIGVNASKNLVNFYRDSRESVQMLLTASASYYVTDTRPVRLTEAARKMMVEEPESFVVACGDGFVRSVKRQAQVLVLVRFESKNVETLKSVQSSVGVGLSFKSVNLSVSLTKLLKDTLKENTSQSVVTVATMGFFPEEGGNIENVAATDPLLSSLDKLRTTMSSSLLEDLCNDGGQAPGVTCRNPGTRRASLVALKHDWYETALNRPSGRKVFDAYEAPVKKTGEYLLAYRALVEKMTYADEAEVRAYGTSSGWDRLKFALWSPVPIEQVPQTIEGLDALAVKWHGRLRPDGGTDVTPLLEKISTCATSAGGGGYGPCLAPPRDEQAWKNGRRALDEYVATGRILPASFLRYAPVALSDLPTYFKYGNRLATREELARAAFMIPWEGVPNWYGTALPEANYRVWFADTLKPGCAANTALAFTNPPKNTKSFAENIACASAPAARGFGSSSPKFSPLAVPATGAFETPVDL